MQRMAELTAKYPRPGRNDLFALVLAEKEICPLLTGDKDLKVAAESENVEVRGTLWLVSEMVRTGKISVQVARCAYQRMRSHGRRLPWDIAEKMLTGHRNQKYFRTGVFNMANGGNKNGNDGNPGFEAEMFKAVDKLRSNMEPSDYKQEKSSGQTDGAA